MWVEFVVGSRPCSEGFSPGTPVFLPPEKPTFLNSNSTWNARTRMLFVLCAEILGNAIRQDVNIRGFKVSQYSDGNTVFVLDLSSAENLFKILHEFQKCSGLEVNLISKTEGMWLGANRHNNTKHFGIAWPSDFVFALGIHFSNDIVSFQKHLKKSLVPQCKPR